MARARICPVGHTYQPSDPDGDVPCPICAAENPAAASFNLPMSGTRVQEFTPQPQFPGLDILEEISPGVGGMGVVYKAREKSLDRIVAVKTAKTKLQTAEGQAFFQREARAAARLDHPNILRIFRFDPDHPPPYYVMEFLEGRHLDRACRGRDARYVAAMMEKIARALAYAHERGVVHRDIKPANILVDSTDEPHVADFGVAGYFDDARAPERAAGRANDHLGNVAMSDPLLRYSGGGLGWGPDANKSPEAEPPPQPSPGVPEEGEKPPPPVSRASAGPTLVGTPAFIAPEVYDRSGEVGPEIDVYALGVMLYELLTQKSPFPGKTFQEIREAVLRAMPPLPQSIHASIPEPLQRICLMAMEKDPAARYESARDMADDLRRFLDGREVAARPARYQLELRGKLQNHLTDVRLWNEQSLIDLRDMDRLSRPYNALLEAASPWLALSRRFPWESIALRLGGWLVLISSVLWPMFYWGTLTRTQRVLAIGLPALAVNLVGWILRLRGSRVNSLVYLSTGALLLPLLASVVLTEYRLVPHAQSESRELFGAASQTISSIARNDYAPTNLQLTISAGAFCIYCALLLIVTRAKVLAAWLGVGGYLLFSGLLLLAGLKEWLTEDHVAQALLRYLIAAWIFWGVASWLQRRPFARTFAATFFAFFVIPFALVVSLLARYGSVEWLHASPQWNDETINQWLMADGLIYLLGGLWFAGARASHVRFWGAMLLLLVPIHLLTPTQILFDKPGHDLFMLGAAPMTRYELMSVVLATALIALGTRLRHNALVLPALAGLAAWVFRATERHFQAYRSWPLAIATTGGIAMTAALISLLWRARKRKEPMI